MIVIGQRCVGVIVWPLGAIFREGICPTVTARKGAAANLLAKISRLLTLRFKATCFFRYTFPVFVLYVLFVTQTILNSAGLYSGFPDFLSRHFLKIFTPSGLCNNRDSKVLVPEGLSFEVIGEAEQSLLGVSATRS